jgi:hypothetical protein
MREDDCTCSKKKFAYPISGLPPITWIRYLGIGGSAYPYFRYFPTVNGAKQPLSEDV